MPAPSTPVRLYNIYAPQRNGVYGDVFGRTPADTQIWVKGDGMKQRIGLIAPAPPNVTERAFDFIDPTGATVEIAIGAVSSGGVVGATPTGGTFKLTYSGSSTNLTALAYNISAAALKAALESNTTFNPGGNTVTVTVTNPATGYYRVAWDQVGVRSLLAGDGTNLTPGSQATASSVVTGSASVAEVQIIRLLQRPYAYNATWSSFASAAASVTQIQTGSSTKPSIQRVTLDPEPYDGSAIVTFGQPEIVRVQCKANSGGVAEVSSVITVADVSNSLSGVYFDLYDNAGPVRVWINVSAGSTAPATPSGGRLLAVAISTNDSAGTVGTAVKNAIDADSKFAASNVTATVTITDSNTGARTDISAGTSTFSASVSTQGVNSILDDKYFVIYDASDSSVAVWLTLDGLNPPSGVTDQNRYISVTIGATDSANTIGGLIATAVDADADFTASNSSGIVTITAASNGSRTTATNGDSGMSVAVTQEGITLSPVIAWNATPLEIQDAIDPQSETVIVSKTGPFSWDFQFVANGSRSAIAADVTGLKVPIGLVGTLNLATDQMLAASVAAGGVPFQALIEGQVTFSGELPWTFYRETITIFPDLIDFSTVGPANLPDYLLSTSAGFVHWSQTIVDSAGGSTKLDGVATATLTTGYMLGFTVSNVTRENRIYRLTDTGSLPAESDPIKIRPDTTDGTRYWELVSLGMYNPVINGTLTIGGATIAGDAGNGTLNFAGSYTPAFLTGWMSQPDLSTGYFADGIFYDAGASNPVLDTLLSQLQGNWTATGNLTVTGKLILDDEANGRCALVTLVGGTKTVSNTSVTANTELLVTRKTSGGTPGTAITYTTIASTSFTINSDNPLDTSTFFVVLIERD